MPRVIHGKKLIVVMPAYNAESTVAQTVIAGVLVFVAGQLFLKLVIEPIHQLKKTFADIAHTFVRYAHALHNPDVIPPELHSEVFEKLRQLSGQLYADMALIPSYPVFRSIFFLPRREKVRHGDSCRPFGLVS